MIDITQIKEKKLIDYKNEIDYILYINNIDFECDYNFEPNPELNSTLAYHCLIDKRARGGLVCHNKDSNSFGGAVLKTEKVEYLTKEGFSDEQTDKEPVWVKATSPKLFVTMMAFPFHEKLKFK
jgi:hypothetical protein